MAPTENGIANGHIPHSSLDDSSQSASTERIQIINEEKNFTLASSVILASQQTRRWHFFADQTWQPRLTSGAYAMRALHIISFRFLVLSQLERVSRMQPSTSNI